MAKQLKYPRICIALGFEDPRKFLSVAREEANEGGRFLEFRLDYLREPEKGPDLIAAFHDEYPECDVLATCRRVPNGGHFRGDIEEQLCILEAAITSGARAIDVEIESAENAKSALRRLSETAELIVSYHNFNLTPALEPVLRRLTRIPASAYKVVGTATKPSDNFRLLSLLKSRKRTPLVVQAMGEVGLPVRVLSPLFGGLYSYAAPSSETGTAPGQVSAHDMRQLFRLEKLASVGKIYGVIADPVSHSVSPAVHNRAFQSRRIDSIYLPFRVEPKRLKDFFYLAAQLPVAGFSVTIPHKEKVIRHLDIVEPLARRIGAVNTVWRKAGKWRGTNTDVDGVIVPLRKHLRLEKSTVLVVGSGGAARGAAFALADQGARVTITGRDEDRLQIRRLARVSGAEELARDDLGSRHFDALVHATPLGMHPNVKECFFDGSVPADIVLDMVYNPLETELLRRARRQKKTVVPGTKMFLEQAARQFEIWTGSTAPRAVMDRAMAEALSHG